MNKARLEEWAVYFDIFTNCYRLKGRIYTDGRFPDGNMVSTSKLVSIDFENKTARTLNTEYVLGVPEDG